MKKLKFKNFFLKELVLWGIVALLTAAICVGLTISGLCYSIDSVFFMNNAEAVSALKDSKSQSQTEFILSSFYDSITDSPLHLESVAVLCDSETGEIAATSALDCYAVISAKHSDTGEAVYLKNKSEDFRELIVNYEKINQINGILNVEEIYVDGDGFYPGRVTIGTVDISAGNAPQEYDFTPENAAEYKKIREHFLLNAAGSAPDSELFKAVTQNPSTPQGLNGLFYYGSLRNDFKLDGRTYDLHSYCNFDLWGLAGGYIIAMIITIFIICIGIAFLIARHAYRKYCTQYEIDEYRRNMTNALAHDLKSPLTAIYGYTENLKNNVHTEKREYYADAVLENVQYMNEIITSTLELNKLELNGKKLSNEKIDITVLAEELYGKYRPQAESRGITFRISGKAVVQADRKLISQAVENLISNAVKYTADSGEISISASEKEFAVSNTCDSSITAENLEKPFEKADSSRSNRRGSGLGLAIVKNIAALHKFGFEAIVENEIFTAKITF